MTEINLKELLDQNKAVFLDVSQEIAKEGVNIKLNCIGVNDLTNKQISWLFAKIPKKYILCELDNYINLDTVSDQLHKKFANYIRSYQLKKQNLKIRIRFFVGTITLILLMGTSRFIFNKYLFTKNDLDTNSITIGVLGQLDRYAPLVKYLQSELGGSVQIAIDGFDNMSYQLAINRIQLKQWDIAFTLSPTISVAAEDSKYYSVARMFAHLPPSYKSVMFVKKDSDINTLDDITPNTIIALGSNDSASSFYSPIYYLYGEKLTINFGNRGEKIKELVRKGEADIGAGAMNDVITQKDLNNDLKIISYSIDLPGAGVYVSPLLSESDRQTIATLLNNAPIEAKDKDHANYGDPNTKIDYSGYRELIKSVEKIITCADFTVNPVSLFCNTNQEYLEIEGKVQDWLSKKNNYQFTIVDKNKVRHKVHIGKEIAFEIIGEDNPISLNKKKVRIKYIASKNKNYILINNPLQLKILSK